MARAIEQLTERYGLGEGATSVFVSHASGDVLPAELAEHLRRQTEILEEIPRLRAQVQRLGDELAALRAGAGKTTAEVLALIRSFDAVLADQVAASLGSPGRQDAPRRSSRRRR
jgi:type II secretory pathway component PulM